MESKARQMEQSSLLERLQQLLHQSLQSNLATTVSTACSTSSNRTWLQGSRQPPGSAVCHKTASIVGNLYTSQEYISVAGDSHVSSTSRMCQL